VRINHPELLRLALTHRSYLHVTPGEEPRESNERLEFLGDSVLGLVCSDWLYRIRPDEHEGLLTKTKSLLVSKAILSRRALAMGLGRFVLLSHSEVESGGRQRLSILADAFEAVIGAIYIDQGLEAARQFIQTWLLNEAGEIAADKRHTNYKSLLQEYVQSTFHTHPVYRIRQEHGPDHLKQFTVEVMVGSRTLGDGRGRNKKEAEQSAARNALERVAAEVARRDEGRRRARGGGPAGAGREGRERGERPERERGEREGRERGERPEREGREPRMRRRDEAERPRAEREERPRAEREERPRRERPERPSREEREPRLRRAREERPLSEREEGMRDGVEERPRRERGERRVREERPLSEREEGMRDGAEERPRRERGERPELPERERPERPELPERERPELPERERLPLGDEVPVQRPETRERVRVAREDRRGEGAEPKREERPEERRRGRRPREARRREAAPVETAPAEVGAGLFASLEAPPFAIEERESSPRPTEEPAAKPEAAYGRKGKPNKRAARAPVGLIVPPPGGPEPAAVAEAPAGTPVRHGPIPVGDLLATPSPAPDVRIVETSGPAPAGAPGDRYRVAESDAPSRPARRGERKAPEGAEDTGP